ncbi:MAG: hypothetical protein FWG10_05695 [Eubacteriaceae bacterium]|nr:hypothetical protein [Eubacteriaceae bacterium]
MYCVKCGQKTELSTAKFCTRCGAQLIRRERKAIAPPQGEDKASALLMLLCFFFPVVGLILFITYNSEYPQKSKSCGIAALIGGCILVFLAIAVFVLLVVSIAAYRWYWF